MEIEIIILMIVIYFVQLSNFWAITKNQKMINEKLDKLSARFEPNK